MVYDLLIIGGGPAGLTAGVYARTRKHSTLILEAQAMGGKLEWLYQTKSVYDYPSYIAIEGGELAQLFALHSRESGAELRSEEVLDLERLPSGFRVRTREGNAYETRSEEHTSELQSQFHLVCRLLLEKKKKKTKKNNKK